MSEQRFRDFCLDYESDYDKKPNAFEVWTELSQQLSASQARAEAAEAELRKLLESKDSPETDIDQATRLNG